MYLVFRSANKSVARSAVYGVQFSMSKPTYVTIASDLIYVDISSMTEADKAKVDRILNNIDTTTIEVIVGNFQSCTLSQVLVTGTNESRKIDSTTWSDVVQPAWYRLINATSMSNF